MGYCGKARRGGAATRARSPARARPPKDPVGIRREWPVPRRMI